MKMFRKTYRLQADSIKEIGGAYEESAVRVSHAVRFRGNKLRPGPLLNALVLAFVEMTEEEQERVAQLAVKRLEDVMDDAPARTPREFLPKGDLDAIRDTPTGGDLPQPPRPKKRKHNGSP